MINALVALDRMDIQVTFDGLRLNKAANLQANKAGAEVTPNWNYGAFIRRAEVRVFASDVSTDGRPLAILPLKGGRSVGWTVNRRPATCSAASVCRNSMKLHPSG